MIKKDITSYVRDHWDDLQDSIRNLSANNAGIPLVNCEDKMYSFDKICKTLFPADHPLPTSVDGLLCQNDMIELVEFKSGFVQRITKENFDVVKGACPHLGTVCKWYWDLFWENQDKKVSELIDSLRLKAIESYILLEKHIFPSCPDADPICMKLTVVIDADPVDSMEDTLAELSEPVQPSSSCSSVLKNSLQRVRKALHRLSVNKDHDGNTYYYDQIVVLSAVDYKSQLKSFPRN